MKMKKISLFLAMSLIFASSAYIHAMDKRMGPPISRPRKRIRSEEAMLLSLCPVCSFVFKSEDLPEHIRQTHMQAILEAFTDRMGPDPDKIKRARKTHAPATMKKYPLAQTYIRDIFPKSLPTPWKHPDGPVLNEQELWTWPTTGK